MFDLTVRQLGRCAFSGFKYAFVLTLIGIVYHALEYTVTGRVHAGLFNEFYWEFWGTFWGVFWYRVIQEY